MRSRIFNILLVAVLAIGTYATATAQQDKSKRKSPPVKITETVGDLTMTIDYSSPSVRGRDVWGALVPYGKVWRTGANEATTLEFSKAVNVEGQPVAAGKYALFTIPGETEWTFILNKEADQWGAYGYKESEDALRFTAKPGKAASFTEQMAFEVATKGDQAAYVTFKWADLAVGFPVEPTK